MRPLELLLLVALSCGLATRWPRNAAAGWPAVAGCALAVVLLLHLTQEGWRREMVPAYALAAGLGLALLTPVGSARLLWALGGGTLLAAAAIAASLFPVFRLPPPDGRFAVGMTEIVLAGAAELPIPATLWYPTAGPGAPAAYVDGPPGDRATRVVVAAARDAPPGGASGLRPVVVTLPGWLGTRRDMTVLGTALASRGYIVVALDDVGHAAQAPADDRAPMDLGSDATFAATRRHAEARLVRGVALVGDALDGLVRMNSGRTPLAGRLDLARVGVVGFSFGGAVAAEALRSDRRIGAVANMDGWLFGDAARDGVPGPYLFLSDDTPLPTEADLAAADPVRRANAILGDADDRSQRANIARLGGARVTITGTGHTNFSDAAFSSPWRRLTGAGLIEPARAARLIRKTVAAFLDFALLGVSEPLEADPSLRVERWPPPADNRRHATLSAAPR